MHHLTHFQRNSLGTIFLNLGGSSQVPCNIRNIILTISVWLLMPLDGFCSQFFFGLSLGKLPACLWSAMKAGKRKCDGAQKSNTPGATYL